MVDVDDRHEQHECSERPHDDGNPSSPKGICNEALGSIQHFLHLGVALSPHDENTEADAPSKARAQPVERRAAVRSEGRISYR